MSTEKRLEKAIQAVYDEGHAAGLNTLNKELQLLRDYLREVQGDKEQGKRRHRLRAALHTAERELDDLLHKYRKDH